LTQFTIFTFKYSVVYLVFRFIGSGLLTELDHDKWHKRRVVMDPAFHKK